MNRFNKINISPLLSNITKNKSSFKINQLQKCFNNTTITTINNNNNNSNNNSNIFKFNNSLRSFSTNNQQQTKVEDFNPHPGVVTPKTAFQIDLSKYKTNEKLSDLNPDHLVYQTNKEALYKYMSPSLSFQALIGISAPIIAYYNELSFKTVAFLTVFSFWGVSFKFIGEKLGSSFVIRLYREPGSDYVRLVHINPYMTVLKIPIADIQKSNETNKKVLHVLLDNGAIFFFEMGGILYKEEDFNYILSGEANELKNKKLEQEEYAKFFETSSKEDLEAANQVLDFELELLEKKIEEAKKEKELEEGLDKEESQQNQNDKKQQ